MHHQRLSARQRNTRLVGETRQQMKDRLAYEQERRDQRTDAIVLPIIGLIFLAGFMAPWIMFAWNATP